MTTAKLSVGIDTQEAYAALKALRAEMQNQPHNLLISVDAKSVDRDIERYLKQRTFKISVNTKALGAEIANDVGIALDRAFERGDRKLSWNVAALRGGLNSAIDPIFNDPQRRLRFDQAGLTAQVHASVAAGLAGGVLKVDTALGVAAGAGGVGAPTTAGSVPILNVIRETLLPAVDRMTMAADQLAAVARRTSVGGTSGSAVAKRSISTKDEQGFTTSFSQKLENPELQLAGIQVANYDKKADSRELLNLVGQRDNELKRMRAQATAEELNEVGQRASQLKALKAQATGEELNELGQRTELLRARRAQAAGQELNEIGQRAELFRQRRAQSASQELNEVGQRADQLRRIRAQSAGEELNEVGQRASQLKALKAQATFNEQGFSFGPDRSTYDASLAAGRLKESKAVMDEYRASTKETAAAHRVLTGTMNEAHSAARGLAGSMGAMWATYGSIVPLVAAAAIGASLKNVFTVGKEVEYQLAFVSALSEGAVVSVDKFGQSVRGSLVLPAEASQAMRGLAQNGLSVGESFAALPSILALATAGEMSLSDAALGATGVMAAFNLTVNDLGHVGDVFAKAAAISNTSVQGMVESMKQASTVGDQFHVTIEETAASLAVLAQRNITGSAGGTALRNMLTELYAPSKRAKEAFASLGLELYDSNKQLIPYREALLKLRDTVILLNEPSRNEFLTTVFNERGVKGASALLSDMDLFNEKFKEISTNSSGFAQGVNDALGETSAGKLKKLFSEFELASDSAFNSASTGVKGFTDSLRVLVNSKDFQDTLTNLVNGVVTLTRFLQENAQVILTTVGVWAAFKIIDGVIVSFVALRGALAAASIGVTAFGTAAMTALGAATGGVAIVLALAAEYLLLKDNTTGAERALRAHTDATTLANAESDTRVKKMIGENEVLSRQTELMWQGVDAAKAKLQAEAEQGGKTDAKGALSLSQNEALLADAKARLANQQIADQSNAASGTFDTSQSDALQKEITLLEKSNAEDRKALDLSKALARESVSRARETDQISLVSEINSFNAKLEQQKSLKASITIDKINLDWAKALPPETVRDEMKKRMALLNKEQLNTFTAPDHKSDRTSHNDTLAEIEDRKHEYERDVKLVEAKYKTEDVLLRARQQAGLISSEEYETTLNVVAARHSKERVTLAQKEADDIQAIADKAQAADAGKPKNKRSLTDADRSKIDRDLEDAKAKASAASADETLRAATAAVQLEGALKKSAEAAKLIEMKHAVDDMKALRDLARSMDEFSTDSKRSLGAGTNQTLYGAQPTTGLSADQREVVGRENFERSLNGKLNKDTSLKGQSAKDTTLKAGLAAYDAYATDLLNLGQKLDHAQGLLDDINARKSVLQQDLELGLTTNAAKTREDIDALAASAESLGRNVESIKKEVSAVESMRDNSVATRSTAAKAAFDYERSAQAGMLSFWKQYRDEATNSAKLVNNVMSQTFSSMEQGLMQFVTTGKLNFKDFSRSVLADAARMFANDQLRKLLGLALNFVVGAASSGSGSSTTVNGSAGDVTVAPNLAAHGGVYTEYGVLPLRKYASGGVEHGPAVTIHGEGSLPEANVPLQDGRTIPVTLSGGTGGGGATTVSIQVNIDSNGKSQVESDTSGNKANALAQMMESEMMRIIAREKRAGGLLYA